MIQLRNYQEDAIEALYRWFEREAGNPLIVIPTGGGKSVIQAAFIERAFQDDPACRVLCVTHVKELIAQNWQRLRQIWPSAPAGVNSASLNRRDTLHPILFAGVQSILILGIVGCPQHGVSDQRITPAIRAHGEANHRHVPQHGFMRFAVSQDIQRLCVFPHGGYGYVAV